MRKRDDKCAITKSDNRCRDNLTNSHSTIEEGDIKKIYQKDSSAKGAEGREILSSDILVEKIDLVKNPGPYVPANND